MTAQRQDEKLDYFRKALTVSNGNISDLELRFYQTDTPTTINSIRDAKRAWLVSQGQTVSSVEDMWFKYLTSQGYSGSTQDMEKAFYRDNS